MTWIGCLLTIVKLLSVRATWFSKGHIVGGRRLLPAFFFPSMQQPVAASSPQSNLFSFLDQATPISPMQSLSRKAVAHEKDGILEFLHLRGINNRTAMRMVGRDSLLLFQLLLLWQQESDEDYFTRTNILSRPSDLSFKRPCSHSRSLKVKPAHLLVPSSDSMLILMSVCNRRWG